jgi:hypothetical protein
MNETNTTTGEISQLGNVDQIREILFGSQSRELQERFKKLEASIESMQSEMRKKIEQTQNDFNARLESELEGITRKIKNITTHQQDEFADLRDSALKQEKRIQNSLDVLEEELHAKNEQLAKQQLESNNALRGELDALKDEIIATLDEKMAQIGEAKLSRDDAAEILMEAAMAMKGSKLNQQLAISQIVSE